MLRRIFLCQPKDFDRLKPIHIAGTKGKGSTSALISSILAQYLDSSSSSSSSSSATTGNGLKSSSTFKLRKIGLYTSPHLRSVRERIQINNEPLSESDFAKYFFEVWDRLENAARTRGEDPSANGAKPMYFRYLTLMALHTYMSEGVGSAVIECGIGGEYDATNVLVQPTVTAITALGIDHVNILGSTLRDIAWHKSGIFKPGAHALTVVQPPEALDVLRARARERNVELHVVERNRQVDSLKLGLAGDFQKINASVAVAAVTAHLRKLGHPEADNLLQASDSGDSKTLLPSEFQRGLEAVRLAGRCDIRRESDRFTWYIDGGHTIDSVRIAGEWYASCVNPNQKQKLGSNSGPETRQININGSSTSINAITKPSSTSSSSSPHRILIFNQQSRDAVALAKTLFTVLADGLANDTRATSITPNSTHNNVDNKHHHPVTHAFFSTNVTYRQNGYKPDLVSINADVQAVQALSVQHALANLWKKLDPDCDVRVFATVEEAVAACRDVASAAAADAGVKSGDDKSLDEGKSEDKAEVNGHGHGHGHGNEHVRTEVLVTGSLHLVGGLLEILEGEGQQ